MSNTINEVVCLLPNSSLTDQTGRLWNYRNNGGIQFFENGGVFDQPYIKFTDNTLYKNYLYTRTVEDDNNDFRLGENFTIEFWVRNITLPTKGWCYFIAYHPDNSTGSGWAISYRNTDKKIQFHNSSLPNGEEIPVTNTLISAMTDWTHVAFVKNKKTVGVFVNGIRENIYNNISNTYNIDTNIKDGLYIGRQNSTWNTNDEIFVGDFGGLKISKYARYDVNATNIEILDFDLDTPSYTYNNIIKRNDKFKLYNEAFDGNSNYGYKGMVWKNYKDGYDIFNMNNPNFYTYNYYKYDINDRSIISSISNSPCGYVMFNQFGNIINNIDQDYTIFWDVYIDERWCDLTKTPKCQFLNFCWEQSQTTQIRLFYGRDATSVNKSFAVFPLSGSNPTNESSVTEANRIYFDFKFEPNVKYKFAISQKNHKRYYYINGKLFTTRDISAMFMVYGSNLYSTNSNTELSTSDYKTEIELCEKIDNIFIKIGDSFNTETYDYTNDEYDYDYNKRLDESIFIDYSNIPMRNLNINIETWNKTFIKPYTNVISKSDINQTKFMMQDSNDSRKIDNFTVFLEGKKDKKIEYIDILGTNHTLEKEVKTHDVISKVKVYDINNKIKFINNDELIIYDKNINIVLGYLTGELEQSECKTNGYYIKVFNHNTNRFIGEYEIINGVFTIDNLNYYDYYDVVLCDRLNKIENQVMSKRKPTPYNIYELNKIYEPKINYDTSCELTNLLVLPPSNFFIKTSDNKSVLPLIINDYEYFILDNSNVSYNVEIETKDKPLFIDVMIVGGGGSGGFNNTGGGGGAGGFIRRTLSIEPNKKFTTIGKVGKGGTFDMDNSNITNGTSSSILDIEAFGGGYGGLSRYNDSLYKGNNGGNGGGGAGSWSLSASLVANGKATDPTQGYDGETGYIDANTYSRVGGGGGGAGGAGGQVSRGYGGLGIECDILGESKFYAGGGGSGTNWTSGNTMGGSNIGGNGGNYNNVRPTDPIKNTGSGGAGCGEQMRFPTNGADGIIVIRVNKSDLGITKTEHVRFGLTSDNKFGNIGKASILNKWSLHGNTSYNHETDEFKFNDFASYLLCKNYLNLNIDFEFSVTINIDSSKMNSNIWYCNILMNCIDNWSGNTINLWYMPVSNQGIPAFTVGMNSAISTGHTMKTNTVIPYDTDAKITLKRLNNIFYIYVNENLETQREAWFVENRNTYVFGAWMGGNTNQQFFGSMKNFRFNYL